MATKRPHFVPKTYLRAWANPAEQVAYRRRDSDQAIQTNITNVAVAGGIYGAGELSEARERLFQQVEEEWVGLRFELTTQGDLRGKRRSVLALFLALQLARGLKHSEQNNFIVDVAARTDERPIPKSAVHEYFQALDGVPPEADEVEAAWSIINGAPGIPTADQVFGVALDVAVTKVAPALESMNWTVHKYGRPVLWSCDSPVHCWRRPTEENKYRGVGIGNADEVRFPLSPSALLVMTRKPLAHRDLPKHRAINFEISRQCHKFVIATPQSRAALDEIDLSKRAPRVRFSRGPGYRRNPDGTDEYLGEVIHQYVE